MSENKRIARIVRHLERGYEIPEIGLSSLPCNNDASTAASPNYDRYKHLKVEIKNGIALVTLNRPEKLNAMNHRMHWEVSSVWEMLDSDPNVRVSVVTGAPTPPNKTNAFSAGGDLDMIDEMIKSPSMRREIHQEASAIVYNIVHAKKPIISAINGVAVGAGLAVAVMADISIAARSASFSDGHVKLGVAAGDHAALWPSFLGMAKARYYLMTGEAISADEAERAGLVSLVVPDEDVLKRAFFVAEKLANGAQHAIRATKLSLNKNLNNGPLQAFDLSMAMEMINFTEEDVLEGVRALKEKRKPKFPSSQ